MSGICWLRFVNTTFKFGLSSTAQRELECAPTPQIHFFLEQDLLGVSPHYICVLFLCAVFAIFVASYWMHAYDLESGHYVIIEVDTQKHPQHSKMTMQGEGRVSVDTDKATHF